MVKRGMNKTKKNKNASKNSYTLLILTLFCLSLVGSIRNEINLINTNEELSLPIFDSEAMIFFPNSYNVLSIHNFQGKNLYNAIKPFSAARKSTEPIEWTIPTDQMNTQNFPIYDYNGDRIKEVMGYYYNETEEYYDYYSISGNNGSLRWNQTEWEAIEYPADIDNDGEIELIIQKNSSSADYEVYDGNTGNFEMNFSLGVLIRKFVIVDIDLDNNMEIISLFSNDTIQCIDIQSKQVEWSYTSQDLFHEDIDISKFNLVVGNVDDSSDIVVIFSNYFELYCIDGISGDLRWKILGTVESAITPADIDNDGEIELLFKKFLNLVSISGKTGEIEREYPLNAASSNEYLIADIDQDMKIEIITILNNNTLICLNGETFAKKWEYTNPDNFSSPTLGDIDGDDEIEIIIGKFNGIICVNGKTGEEEWFREENQSGSAAIPIIVDLNGDGELEILLQNDENTYCTFEDEGNAWAIPGPWPSKKGSTLMTGNFIDSDQDKLFDAFELSMGLDIFSNDTDKDGMPDGWENQFLLNPFRNDADENLDGDAWSNYEEFIRGSNPRDDNSNILNGPYAPLIFSIIGLCGLFGAYIAINFLFSYYLKQKITSFKKMVDNDPMFISYTKDLSLLSGSHFLSVKHNFTQKLKYIELSLSEMSDSEFLAILKIKKIKHKNKS